jgi:hypothetical protein
MVSARDCKSLGQGRFLVSAFPTLFFYVLFFLFYLNMRPIDLLCTAYTEGSKLVGAGMATIALLVLVWELVLFSLLLSLLLLVTLL